MASDPSIPDDQERGTLLIDDEGLQDGFIMLSKRILRARNLSRDAKLLYAILLDYAWQEHQCFPGYLRLCADMGASEPIVRKYMHELEDCRLLAQKRRGLGKTNIYRLLSVAAARLDIPSRTKETFVQERKDVAPPDQKNPRPHNRKFSTPPIKEEKESGEQDLERIAPPLSPAKRGTGRPPRRSAAQRRAEDEQRRQADTGRFTRGAYAVCPECGMSPHDPECSRIAEA